MSLRSRSCITFWTIFYPFFTVCGLFRIFSYYLLYSLFPIHQKNLCDHSRVKKSSGLRNCVCNLLKKASWDSMSHVIYQSEAMKAECSCFVKNMITETLCETSIDFSLCAFEQTGRRVATLVGLWAISWTPYALVVLISVSFSNSVLTPLLSTMPSIFCKASACLNPYVYGLSLPAFK